MITSANAAEYGRKGAIAAQETRAKVALTLKVLDTSDWQTQELIRIRTQIAKLNEAIEAELAVNIPAVPASPGFDGSPAIGPSGLELDRLTRSVKNLREDERKLAGRPDPGSYRPIAPKSKTAKPAEPIEEA